MSLAPYRGEGNWDFYDSESMKCLAKVEKILSTLRKKSIVSIIEMFESFSVNTDLDIGQWVQITANNISGNTSFDQLVVWTIGIQLWACPSDAPANTLWYLCYVYSGIYIFKK